MLMQQAAKLADTMLGRREVSEGSTVPKVSDTERMKAVTYLGPKKWAVEMMPKPLITHPGDVIVKVTMAAICSGTDSHIMSGELPNTRVHSIIGHEAVGVVEAKGDDVRNLDVGDRVVISTCIGCGTCSYCRRGEFAACDTTNSSKLAAAQFGHCPGALVGYNDMTGGVPGSQAEYVRMPFGDVNCHKIPADVPDEKAVMLSDMMSTGLHAVTLGEVGEGDTVAIWGLGPVGLCAARWAQIKGAKQVIGIDLVQTRLEIARKVLGIAVIDRNEVADVPTRVKELSNGGVDVAIEAVGFRYPTTLMHKIERAVGLETDAPDIITECFTAVRKFGRVSLIGDYGGYANHFPIGQVMMKHLTLRSGAVSPQRYFDYMLEHIKSGEFDPTFIISHRMPIDDAPVAYDNLFRHEEGWVKVVLAIGE